MNQTFIKTKETDALAEAATVLGNLARQLGAQTGVNHDVTEFLAGLSAQVNLYRVAIINGSKTN